MKEYIDFSQMASNQIAKNENGSTCPRNISRKYFWKLFHKK